MCSRRRRSGGATSSSRIFGLEDAYAGLRLLDRLGLLDVLLPEVALGRGVTQPEQFHAYDVFEHAICARSRRWT